MEYLNFLKDLLRKTIVDLENRKILGILIKSVLLTFLFAGIVFIIFYYYLFTSFFNFANNLESSEGLLAYILSFKIITYLVGILQFFISWIIISIILVPVGSIISGIFAEDIFFKINQFHNYKFKKKFYENCFSRSIRYSIFMAFKSFVINILILPLYLILPVANIFIFIFINGFLIGKEFIGNFLVQFETKEKINLFNQYNDTKIYFIGVTIAILYTIPFINLCAPFIGNVMASHLILDKKNIKIL